MRARKLVVVVVSGLLLSGIVGTTGCKRLSGSFPEKACKGPAFSLSEAVVPKLDYAELRDTSSFVEGEEKEGYHVLQRAGERCKTAHDKAACAARVESARATRGFSNQSNGRLRGFRYLVVTRGDDVTVVSGDRELVAALGTVEDPYQAAAVASIQSGLVPACERSVRTEGSAFVVHLASDSCFGPEDLVVRVERDGQVAVVSHETKPGTCVGHAPDGTSGRGSWSSREPAELGSVSTSSANERRSRAVVGTGAPPWTSAGRSVGATSRRAEPLRRRRLWWP